MTFSCPRCRKLFATIQEPLPGRTYRIPCRCGETFALRIETPRPPPLPTRRPGPPPLPTRRPGPPPLPGAVAPETPVRFAGAPVPRVAAPPAAARPEAIDPFAGDAEQAREVPAAPALAVRDPDAPLEACGEYVFVALAPAPFRSCLASCASTVRALGDAAVAGLLSSRRRTRALLSRLGRPAAPAFAAAPSARSRLPAPFLLGVALGVTLSGALAAADGERAGAPAAETADEAPQPTAASQAASSARPHADGPGHAPQ